MSRVLLALVLAWLLVGCVTTGANGPRTAESPQSAHGAGIRGGNGK